MSSAKSKESMFFAHFKTPIGHDYSPQASFDGRSKISSSLIDEMSGSWKKGTGQISICLRAALRYFKKDNENRNDNTWLIAAKM